MVVVTLIVFLLFESPYTLYVGGEFREANEWVKEIKADYLIRVQIPGVFLRCKSGTEVMLGITSKRCG